MAYTVSRDNMKRAIRKIRQVERNEPANPSIRDDFEISEDYRSIKVKRNGREEYIGFLAYDSAEDENGVIVGDPNRIIIYATEDGLKDMLLTKHWAGDAQFNVPLIFYQMLPRPYPGFNRI